MKPLFELGDIISSDRCRHLHQVVKINDVYLSDNSMIVTGFTYFLRNQFSGAIRKINDVKAANYQKY